MPNYTGDPNKPINLTTDELTTQSPGHPNTFNPKFRQMLDNDANLDKRIGDHKNASVLDHPDGSVTDAKIGNRTADPAQAPTSNGPGTLTQWLSWITNRIKAILGGTLNWWDAPPTTLTAAKSHMDATTGVHGATSTATPNTIVQRDPAGRFKAAAPAEADDVARKQEVDAAQGTANAAQSAINAHVARTDNPHGTTAAQVGAPSLSVTIPDNVSLNTVVTSGFYRLSQNHPDAPNDNISHGQMIVSRGADTVLQIVTGWNNNNFYIRQGNPPEAGNPNGTWQPWRKLWHDGNDGAGSGLDADTVRGYVPVNKSGDTMDGPLTSDAFGFRTPPADRPLITKGWDPFTSGLYAGLGRWGIFMEEGRMGFGLPGGDPRVFHYREDSTIAAEYRLWHEGNDGAGSGLDADLLDGLHASSFWTKSEIPYETGNWTPNVEIGGVNASYVSRSGTYIRIRDLVYWTFHIELSSKNGGTGSIAIGAFPFPIGPANGIIPMGKINGAAFPSWVYWAHLLVPWDGATFFYLQASGNFYGDYALTGDHIANNSILAASGVCRISP